MIKIYQKYILNNIFYTCSIFISIITAILYFGQIIKFTFFINKKINLYFLFKIIFVSFPIILWQTLPFIGLLTVVYTYYKLYQNNELLILLNCGLVKLRLLIPALLFSLIITIINYFIGILVTPISYSSLKNIYNFNKSNISLLNHYLPNRLIKLTNDLHMYIDNKTLLLIETKNQINIIQAKKRFISEQQMLINLYDGNEYFIDDKNSEIITHFDHIVINLKKLILKYNPPPKKSVKEYTFYELISNKKFTQIYQKLVWPLYCIILPMLGILTIFQFNFNNNFNNRYVYLLSFFIAMFSCYSHFLCLNLKNIIQYIIPTFWIFLIFIVMTYKNSYKRVFITKML